MTDKRIDHFKTYREESSASSNTFRDETAPLLAESLALIHLLRSNMQEPVNQASLFDNCLILRGLAQWHDEEDIFCLLQNINRLLEPVAYQKMPLDNEALDLIDAGFRQIDSAVAQ
ncbi:MAG: hypothetical protein CMJ46_04265 [Planctomyces sp.]|nr:hypothetical protein [Planctomyces sp.]